MQLYAEQAVAQHMSYLQKQFNQQANIKSGTIWKEFSAQLELAVKQTDRWKNLKKKTWKRKPLEKLSTSHCPCAFLLGIKTVLLIPL